MWTEIKKYIIQAVTATLLITIILGSASFVKDYIEKRALQEKENTENIEYRKENDKYHKENDENFNIIIKNIQDYTKKVDDNSLLMKEQIKKIDKKLNVLTYVVSQNETIAKQLKEMKENGLYNVSPSFSPVSTEKKAILKETSFAFYK